MNTSDVMIAAFWTVTVLTGGAGFFLVITYCSGGTEAGRVLIWLGCWATVLYLALLMAYLWLVGSGNWA
jgi:hypothetical protein